MYRRITLQDVIFHVQIGIRLPTHINKASSDGKKYDDCANACDCILSIIQQKNTSTGHHGVYITYIRYQRRP